MADEFSEKQLDQLEGRMRKVFNEGIDALVIPQLDEIKETLTDHGQQLVRIESKHNAQQQLIDYHDREVERLLKHSKLKPLPLE